MTDSLWIALIITALGTFAMRALPLLWMQRHLAQRNDQPGEAIDGLPTWLGVLGPCVVAALAGSSMVPATQDLSSWLATVIGLLTTWLVWHQSRSMGWPILVGVSAFGISKLLAVSLFAI